MSPLFPLSTGGITQEPPRRRGLDRIVPAGRSNTLKEKTTRKKAARFPERPFLSYGSSTLTGDFGTSAPGAYLPAVSYSGAAASRDSRELEPGTDAMVSHLRKMAHWAAIAA
jgi:hypothetical protein